MREIKFRVWETISATMTPLHSLTDWDIKNLVKDFSKPNKIENVKLMQYTGLRDKNGVEIYEGDIVHDTMSGGGPAEVKVDKGNFYIDWGEWPDWSWSEMAYDHMDRVEVIGNIYENPELLK